MERREALFSFLQRLGIIGNLITPAQLGLYNRAFSHRSYLRECNPHGEFDAINAGDYERLEFLGDRVLNLIIAEYLYKTFNETEGEMTPRMEVARNRNLAAMVPSLGIGFEDLIIVSSKQGITPGIIADAFEAFVGAMYLDIGLDKTRNIVLSLISDEIDVFSTDNNYKKMLQEILQKKKKPLPVYILVRKDGLDHLPTFTYRVCVDEKTCGQGKGRSKAHATQNAAKDALEKMESHQSDEF